MEKSKKSVYVIIRTYSAGVHAGIIVSRKGTEVTLKNSRRIWYWDGAASLSEMSQFGVSKPMNCKFPAPVPEITLTQCIEIIPCSKIAQKIISEVPIWSHR